MEAYCRLCVQKISSKHSVNLFRNENFQQSLAARVVALLDVPVEANDGISQVICERCKRRLVRLEKAAEELTDFRKLASDNYQSFLPRPSLKCTKETSAMVGVSPDTQKARPPPKRFTTRRLDFGQSSSAGEKMNITVAVRLSHSDVHFVYYR